MQPLQDLAHDRYLFLAEEFAFRTVDHDELVPHGQRVLPADPPARPGAEAEVDFGEVAVRKAHGDAAGTRALIEVLPLHRHMPHDHVVAGLAAALRAGGSAR